MTDSRTTISHLGASNSETFMGVPYLKEVSELKADIAIFGARCATPYLSTAMEYSNANLDGPRAIRQAISPWAWAHDRYDWDSGGLPYVELNDRVVDLGDLPLELDTAPRNRQLIKETIEVIVAADAAPFVMGGDDSIPIPILWELESIEDLTVLQIDSHPDCRDEAGGGERYGLSSAMRRASELPNVRNIIQVGTRGLSSAGRQEVDDAKAWGVRFFPGCDVLEHGIDPILKQIEPGANVFITIDLDGIDPSIMPAVYVPAPGGLLYWQVVKLIQGVVAKAKLCAFAMVELVPSRDPEELSAFTAGRIFSNALGAALQR